jgi:tripartite-type tricarboxylate transporter receptor subunit TctC
MEKQKRKFEFGLEAFLWVIIVFAIFVYPLNPCLAGEDPAKFPSKPITMIVPWPPGGTADLSTRKIADSASKILGQPIVIANKGGGAGVIGINAIAKADADGYTIGNITHSPVVMIPHLRSVPYNTKEDFTFIMQFAEFMYAFCVLSDSPWKTFKDFIEEARKRSGKLTYCTPGPLSVCHVFLEQVALVENVKLNHLPVQGDAEMVSQHLGGHVDGSLGAPLIPYIPTGKVRGLAVMSEKRLGVIPDVPTFPELGYKIDYSILCGLVAPKGLDPRVVRKLNESFKKGYEDPSFKEFLATLGMTPVYKDSESFKAMVLKDYDRLGTALKKLGFAK